MQNSEYGNRPLLNGEGRATSLRNAEGPDTFQPQPYTRLVSLCKYEDTCFIHCYLDILALTLHSENLYVLLIMTNHSSLIAKVVGLIDHPEPDSLSLQSLLPIIVDDECVRLPNAHIHSLQLPLQCHNSIAAGAIAS